MVKPDDTLLKLEITVTVPQKLVERTLCRVSETGYGRAEAFYRVAQAISETLPLDSKEKKLLDGFLGDKERLKADLRSGRLF